jgi:hypothetical protein
MAHTSSLRRVPPLVALFVVLSPLACVDASNPYDPETPLDAQARGSIAGVFLLDDPDAAAAVRSAELAAVAVVVEPAGGGAGQTITCDDGDCDEDASTLTFFAADLAPGAWRVSVTGIPARFGPLSPAIVEVQPGEHVRIGLLQAQPLDIDQTSPQDGWTGVVQGVVELDGGAGGARRVALLRREGAGLSLHEEQQTDEDGAFRFERVPPGTYALKGELEGYTPDYEVGFEVRADVPEGENTFTFQADGALTLRPVSAVLVPNVPAVLGGYYTNADEVPLTVLQFGGMTEMRLSTDPDFDGGAQVWEDFAATTTLALPDVEGPIGLHAQFRNSAVPGFEFVSGVFSAEVIRDVTPPTLDALVFRGLPTDEEGPWITSEAAQLTVDVDAIDDGSGVHQVAVHHADDPSEPDPATLSFDLVASPPGLVRLGRAVGLGAGEGEKVVWVALRDRAGNTGALGSLRARVDATPPVVTAVAIAGGAPVTGQADVTLALSATDANSVARARLWNEGASDERDVDFAPLLTHTLLPLDYADTTRQVNVVVYDEAGNGSDVASDTIVLDDRGSLAGVLRVETLTGAPDLSGITAFVDGVSRPIQLTATTGDLADFVVGEVPAGLSRALRLEKAGYGAVEPSPRFAVVAGQATDVGAYYMRLARGAIDGYVVLDGELSHDGIVVELQGQNVLTVTDAAGYFHLDDVRAGTGYTLIFRRDDDFSVETLTGVEVVAGATTTVSTEQSPLSLTPLAGSVAILEGAYTGSRDITLLLGFDGATQYRASESSDFAGDTTPWLPFSQAIEEYAFQLGDSDGLHRVYVQFRDPDPSQGFISDVRSDVIVLDRLAPDQAALTINDGDAYTNVLTATLTLAAVDDNGLDRYQLAHVDTTDPGALQAGDWSASKVLPGGGVVTEVLPGALSQRTVRVWGRVLDPAGNPSLPALAEIVLDPDDPAGLSIVINGGADKTNDIQVQLALTATDSSPIEMRLGDGAVPAGDAWETFATSRAWVVPPSPEGDKTVCVQLRDLAGNETQELCDTIELDVTPPGAPQLSTAAGDATSNPVVPVDFGNVTADVATIELSTDPSFVGAQTSPGQAQVSFTLPDPDGAKSIFARYLDDAGNAGPAAKLDIALDRAPPSLDGFAVAGSGYTRLGSVTLELSATGADQMRFATDGDVSDETFEAFKTVRTGFSIPTGSPGPVTITAQLRDAAGNPSTTLDAQVYFDDVAPSAASVSIDDGATHTNERAVVLSLAGTDADSGVASLAVANESLDCGATSYEPFVDTRTWVLDDLDGTRTVVLCLADEAGNTRTAQAQIELDRSAPAAGALTLAGGASPINSTTASLSVTGGAAELLVTLSGDLAGGAGTYWYGADQDGAGGYGTLPANVTLAKADGSNLVSAVLVDAAGNPSPGFNAIVTVDSTPPADGSLEIAGGVASVQSRSVAASLSSTSGDTMKLWEVAAAASCSQQTCDGSFVPFNPSSTFTLSASLGDKRVCAQVCDDAGNGSTPVFDNVTLDTYQDRPQPVLTSISPSSYVALSAASYPLTLDGAGLASDTQVEIGDFVLDCTTVGSPDGSTCEADVGGGCGAGGNCEATCATQCTVDLPDEIMRYSGSYVVRLVTPDPVFGNNNTSAATRFFTVVAPKPVLTRISPRGIEQLFDEGGAAIADTIDIEVVGEQWMENVLFKLGDNFGEILAPGIVEDGGTGEQRATVRVSTDGVYDAFDAFTYSPTVAELAAVNTGTGGGQDARAFGLNPQVSTWDTVSTSENGTAVIPRTGAVRGDGSVYVGYGLPRTNLSQAVLVHGDAHAVALRATDGALIGRFTRETTLNVAPTPLASGALEVEDRKASTPSVTLSERASGTKYYGGAGTFSVTDDESVLAYVGDYPRDIRLADVDADGRLDLLVAADDGLVINHGTDPAAPDWRTYEVGVAPSLVSVGDLNNDGWPDVVTMNRYSDDISILLGDGAGGFAAAYEVAMTPCGSLHLADLDADGAIDVVCGGNIRLGNGDGTLEPETSIGLATYAVGDVDYDGHLDLVGDSSGLKLRRGLGEGVFGSLETITTSPRPTAGARLVDVNADGALDVVWGQISSNVRVALGDADGTFTLLTAFSPGASFSHLEVADMNGDRIPDLVTTHGSSTDLVRIHPGVGDGTFAAPDDLSYDANNLAIGDVGNPGGGTADGDLDGVPDIVVNYFNNMRFYYGAGGDEIAVSSVDAVGVDTEDLTVADLNRDGIADIVTFYDVGTGGAVVHLGNADGTLTLDDTYPSSTSLPWNVITTDIDSDGDVDVAGGDFSSRLMLVWPGDGSGALGTLSTYAFSIGPRRADARDLNGDGRPDLLGIYASGIQVRLQQSGGGFAAESSYSGSRLSGATAGDIDNDGVLDVVGSGSYRLGVGDGTFGASQSTGLSSSMDGRVALGDLDGDGWLDLVSSDISGGDVQVALNDGAGGFSTPDTYADVTTDGYHLILEDLDGDGALDAIAGDGSSDTVVVLLGDGAGAFYSQVGMPIGQTDSSSPALYPAGSAGSLELAVVGRSSFEDIHRKPIDIPGTWTSTLRDNPRSTRAALAGAITEHGVNGGLADVSSVAVTALLSFGASPSGDVDLSLVAPDGQVVALQTVSAYTGWPSSGATEYRVAAAWDAASAAGDLTSLHGVQPAGEWKLRIDNGTGQDAELRDLSVTLRTSFVVPPVGASPARPQPVVLPSGTSGRVLSGSTLRDSGDTDLTCATTSASPDHAFELTLPAANTITARVDAEFDAAVEIFSGSCDARSTIVGGCDTSGWLGAKPEVDALSVSAGTHCIVVDGEGADINQGRFDLFLLLGTPIP